MINEKKKKDEFPLYQKLITDISQQIGVKFRHYSI